MYVVVHLKDGTKVEYPCVTHGEYSEKGIYMAHPDTEEGPWAGNIVNGKGIERIEIFFKGDAKDLLGEKI